MSELPDLEASTRYDLSERSDLVELLRRVVGTWHQRPFSESP